MYESAARRPTREHLRIERAQNLTRLSKVGGHSRSLETRAGTVTRRGNSGALARFSCLGEAADGRNELVLARVSQDLMRAPGRGKARPRGASTKKGQCGALSCKRRRCFGRVREPLGSRDWRDDASRSAVDLDATPERAGEGKTRASEWCEIRTHNRGRANTRRRARPARQINRVSGDFGFFAGT